MSGMVCFSWDVVYEFSSICIQRIREVFTFFCADYRGKLDKFKYGEMCRMKFIRLLVAEKNMHKLMKINEIACTSPYMIVF